MGGKRNLIWLAALLGVLAPSPAQAQIFTPTINPFLAMPPGLRPPGTARIGRLQVGAYLALWDFAPVDVAGVQSEKIKADASPLLTGDYFVNKHLSVGGWWNPFGGKLDARETAGGPEFKVADIDANFWEAHATYYPSARQGDGWSFQAGFTRLHYDVSVIPALREVGVRDFGASFSSLDFWVHRTQQVGTVSIHGERRPIRVFASAGYHTSSQFDRAVNVLVGGSIPISSRLSLSSSVWLHDVGNTNTRVTVGLAGSFQTGRRRKLMATGESRA
jgi:hypothetical protein